MTFKIPSIYCLYAESALVSHVALGYPFAGNLHIPKLVSFKGFQMPAHNASTRPARTGYTFAQQGAAASAGSSSNNFGKYVVKRIPGVDYWSPAWGEETVIRIFPALNPDDNSEFDVFRVSNKPCDFGDWIRAYEAVRNFGQPGVTMLLHNGLDQSYDAQMRNPCWVLYRAITQALNQGQGLAEWIPLTRGSPGRSAPLSRPSKLYLVQCAIFRHKSKDTFGQGKPPLGSSADGPTIVMGLPPSAGESLIKQLEEKAEDWKGQADDIAQYKYGDIVGADDGAFVHIYELGKDPRSRAASQVNPASIYQSSTTSTKAGLDPKGYGVFITKTLDDRPNDVPASLSGIEDLIKSKIRSWDTILDFKSDEEQARVIAPLFPASAILYAFREHPSWIPPGVREAGAYEAKKPVSSSAPAVQQHNPWAKSKPVTPPTAANTEEEVYPEPEVPENFDDVPLPEMEEPVAPKEEPERVKAARAALASARRSRS